MFFLFSSYLSSNTQSQGIIRRPAAFWLHGSLTPGLLPRHPRCGRRLTGTIQLQRSSYGSACVSLCPSLVITYRVQLGLRGWASLSSLLMHRALSRPHPYKARSLSPCDRNVPDGCLFSFQRAEREIPLTCFPTQTAKAKSQIQFFSDFFRSAVYAVFGSARTTTFKLGNFWISEAEYVPENESLCLSRR